MFTSKRYTGGQNSWPPIPSTLFPVRQIKLEQTEIDWLRNLLQRIKANDLDRSVPAGDHRPGGARRAQYIAREDAAITANKAAAALVGVPTSREVAINRYIAEHNRRPKPFIWTKPASAIFDALSRAPEPSV